jgi:alpha-galactosidase
MAMRGCMAVAATLMAANCAYGQMPASIRTEQTSLELQAGAAGPRVVSLSSTGGKTWMGDASEPLIETVEAEGGSVAVKWAFNPAASHTANDDIAFVYDCASPRLRLTWEWKAPATTGPIEHTIHIENLDARVMWIPLEDSVRFHWRVEPDVALEAFYVEKGADKPSAEGTHRVLFPPGSRWSGTSSTYAHPGKGEPREIIPWFAVESRAGSRSGWYAGLEFSGRTRLTLERDATSLRGTAGLNPDPGPFRTCLKPGERFDTPTVFVGAFNGGTEAMGNVLRRWVRQVLTNPRTWANPNYPLLVNNSWGSGMQVNDELSRRMIRDSAELGLDMFHVDAGWFRGVGDWRPDPAKFPQGLAVIADEAHRHGLKFGIWVDWTQAALGTAPGSLNLRDPTVHDWTVSNVPADWKPEEFKGQTIDIGAPAAQAYAQREVGRIVSDYHLDMLEHDGYLVAQGCVREDHPHAPPDAAHLSIVNDGGARIVESANSTDVSYHAVRAYYEIHSNLRKKHPDLLLEVCNDGGRMVDFGSATHGDYFSITDAYDPLSNRRAFYDTSQLLPAAMLEDYVEKWPTPRIENFLYMLRSGMMGWLTIMQDTNSWTGEQREAAKEEMRTYKVELRGLIRDADLFHISPRPDGVHWDGIEYFDPGRGRGVVYAFRGSAEDEGKHRFQLQGLAPDKTYRLRFHDHSAADRTVRGRELLDAGLILKLNVPQSSELVFIEEARAGH